ncbi:MAG: hypothetical protein RIE08_03725 [Acidimicrobiales bacterium]
MSKKKRNSTSPEAIARADRDRQAVEMRRAGLTYDEIADQLGYANKGGAHKAVTRGLSRWMSTGASEELRALELERTETMLRRLWPRIDRESLDLAAVNSAMRVMDYRARITGLYAPAKHQVGVAVTATVNTAKLDATDALRAAVVGMVERERAQLDAGRAEPFNVRVGHDGDDFAGGIAS